MASKIKGILTTLFPRLYGDYILFRKLGYGPLRRQHQLRISSIRKEGKAKVLVVLSNLAMWRLEEVVDLLKKDSRFSVRLAICPFSSYAPDVRQKNVDEIVAYLRKMGWDYVLADDEVKASRLMQEWDPDIVFYPQIYGGIYGPGLCCEENMDRLIAYVPYALPNTSGDWCYNTRYFNLAWRIYYPTKFHLEYARKHSFNRGRNMVIVGDSHASAFLKEGHSYPWKGDGSKKRVIWAPHYSIVDKGFLHRASFLWLYDFMWNLAEEYKDRIQFVFKPHPKLLSALYEHPDWGKERADAYYEMWLAGENTQLETGPYIDLFCTSDALIHDCGSFTAEYHYTGKPVLFVSKDFASIYQGLDDFGTLCLDLHYHAESLEEIRAFIQDVVLDGQDPRKAERESFRQKYLTLPEGSSFEQNVYRSLNQDLFEN